MKIVFFGLADWEKKIASKSLKGHQISFFDQFDDASLSKCKLCEAVSVFIHCKLDKATIAKLPKLRYIATRSTGFDHIDLEACKARKIAVSNVPHYGENTVAEHTFALILSLSRNIHKSYLRTTRENYSLDGLEGFDLDGKTIGVVGAGRIGLHVIKIARGFGMNVLAYDVCQDNFMAETLGFSYVTLPKLLKSSDVITLHAPYCKSTHHLISSKNIKSIKKGALLINTARGGLIETEALISAIDQGIISGAGLDVLEGEEIIMEEKRLVFDRAKEADMLSLIKNHILLSKEEVVYTPHIAFYSREALQRILDTSLENLASFGLGKAINVVC
jgi:D-lactate dehydrogenase